MIDNHVYEVGLARADITPAIGIRLIGYTVREGVSHTVDEPLTATVLLVRSGTTTVAIIAKDWCFDLLPGAGRLRQRCAAALGIPIANVLINYNHTHCAPVVPGFMPYDTPDQLARQERSAQDAYAAIEQACKKAATQMQPTRLATGWGEIRGNVNRRQRMPDGTTIMGETPAPEGACDNSVGVIRFDKLDGTPLAVLFRYSCHTVTLGPKTNVISPDYAGAARSLIEKTLGCPSLFLQGCAGNMNPATGIGQDPDGSPLMYDDKNRLGQMLGGEVLKICASLRTHRRRKEPELVHSVAVYWLYQYENIAPGPAGAVRAAQSILKLPLVPFPPLTEVEKERAEWAAKLAATEKGGAREWDWRVAKRFDYWAQLRLDAARQGPNPFTIDLPIQVIHLGGLAIVGVPMEMLAETGQALRAASPAPDTTFVLGYSNGSLSYLPTPQASKEGGMEAKLGYKNYFVPSEIPGEWEPQIRQRALDMIRS